MIPNPFQNRKLVEMKLGSCIIKVWNSGTYVETHFGPACVPALPGIEQSATAEELGYGSDLAAMVREHEVLHTLFALAQGHPFSAVLWDVANRVEMDQARYNLHHEEEANVLALQKLMNGLPVPSDRMLALMKLGLDIPDLITRANEVLRDDRTIQ
jgi:hypothetical protein